MGYGDYASSSNTALINFFLAQRPLAGENRHSARPLLSLPSAQPAEVNSRRFLRCESAVLPPIGVGVDGAAQEGWLAQRERSAAGAADAWEAAAPSRSGHSPMMRHPTREAV